MDKIFKSLPLLDHVSNPNGQKKQGFLWRDRRPKNLRCATLYIGDYEYVNIYSFAALGIKLWLEEDGDLNRNDPFYSFKFIQSKAQI